MERRPLMYHSGHSQKRERCTLISIGASFSTVRNALRDPSYFGQGADHNLCPRSTISFCCCEPFKRNSGECCEAPVGRKVPPYLHVLKPKGGCRAMLKAGASRFGKYLADKRHRYVSKVQKIASRSPLSRTGTAGSAVVGVIEPTTMSAPSLNRCWWCQSTEAQKEQLFSICATEGFLRNAPTSLRVSVLDHLFVSDMMAAFSDVLPQEVRHAPPLSDLCFAGSDCVGMPVGPKRRCRSRPLPVRWRKRPRQDPS